MAITIVLENTSHPGNIGAAARAMYTMGFDKLLLINPCEITDETFTRARSGRSIVENALISDDIDSLNPYDLIYGATCRQRSLHLPVITSKTLSEHTPLMMGANTAILFGNETNGLSNQMLRICHSIIEIPTYQKSSLNLSHAIQLICYELSMQQPTQQTQDLCSLQDRLNLIKWLANKHQESGVLLPHTLDRLTVILNKAMLTQDELKLLYSFF